VSEYDDVTSQAQHSLEAAPKEMCLKATAEDWQWLCGCDVLR